MCGIAGIVDPALNREQGQLLLEKMLKSIRHRGPDHSSSWIDMPVLLGHNRLSIIDLSDRANQPMEYDDLVAVYNGEVYNYLEIKDELIRIHHRFRTGSDTEVILAAYKEWGSECVERFVGMWAFAIWDRTKRELFCSRDRFGIKPFYYIHAGNKFYFGSEYKPLKLSPVFGHKLNDRQISRGLHLGWVCYRDESYFDCLKVLPQGCNLLFKEGRTAVTQYWSVDTAQKSQGSFEDNRRRFRELFEESIKLHRRSDVEVGGLLSGGLDSSSIASVIGAQHADVPFKTFTVYYQGKDQMDERPWRDDVVARYPNLTPFSYSPSDDEIGEAFEHASEAHDVPIPTSAPVNFYFAMRLASRQKIKVVLDGQGADEYLAGYPWSAHRLSPGIAKWREHRLYAAAYSQLHPFLALDGAVPFDLEALPGTRLNQHLYHLMFSTMLPSLLHYGDRIAMAFSIECRLPFLDHRLVEFVFSLNDDEKIRDGESKYILRSSMEGILPKSISRRRDKQPFLGGEMVRWLRGPLKFLLEADFSQLSILDRGKTKRLLEEHQNGDDSNAMLVWRIAALNYWLRRQ